jgi:hypothetical protein
MVDPADADAIPETVTSHVGAEPIDIAHGFVTQDDREAGGRDATLDFVELRVTDAASRDA